MEHTPGPWEIDELTVFALDEAGLMNRFSARVDGGFRHGGNQRTLNDELEANARLIAASPELLEALNQIIWKLERKEVVGSKFDGGVRCEFAKIDRNDAVIEQARAAIAKATGT